MGAVFKSLREDYALPGEKGQCEEYRRCYRMALIKSYGDKKKKKKAEQAITVQKSWLQVRFSMSMMLGKLVFDLDNKGLSPLVSHRLNQ